MYEFAAELWLWDARRHDTWTFLGVPAEVSEDLREWSLTRPPAGFGSLRVSVTIGATTWRTSVFPAADGTYVLPVKKAIRTAEGVEAGDTVQVTLRLVGPEDGPHD